jgi:hypothetical protein
MNYSRTCVDHCEFSANIMFLYSNQCINWFFDSSGHPSTNKSSETDSIALSPHFINNFFMPVVDNHHVFHFDQRISQSIICRIVHLDPRLIKRFVRELSLFVDDWWCHKRPVIDFAKYQICHLCKSHDIDAVIISFDWVYHNHFSFLFNESANDNPKFSYFLKSDVSLFAASVHPYRNSSDVDFNGKIVNEIISEFLPKNLQSDFLPLLRSYIRCAFHLIVLFWWIIQIWNSHLNLENIHDRISISFTFQMMSHMMSNFCTNSNSNKNFSENVDLFAFDEIDCLYGLDLISRCDRVIKYECNNIHVLKMPNQFIHFIHFIHFIYFITF